MKGVTNSVLYLLYIQENCVRAYRRWGGVQTNAYALRTHWWNKLQRSVCLCESVDNFLFVQMATLAGMWGIPMVMSMKFGWYRFIVIWAFFSLVTFFITFKATRRPLSGTTPR